MEETEEENGIIERQVKLWCDAREYPFEKYIKLSTPNKFTLQSIICKPQRKTSDRQRQDLRRSMFSAGSLVEGRDDIDSIPIESQEILLSPLTPEEITQRFARL